MKLYAYIAAALLLVGVGWYLRYQGVTAERARWEARQAHDLAAYNDELQKQTADTRAKEIAAAQRQADADKRYQENLTHAHEDRDRAFAQLRAGTLRLHNLEALQAAAAPEGGTAAPAGRSDGQAGTDLSEATARFLVDLASDADEVVGQLTACQEIVVSDRAP